MFSAYASGDLKPPIFYNDRVVAAPEEFDEPKEHDQNHHNVETDFTLFEELPSHDKRLVLSSQNNDVQPDIIDEADGYNDFPLKSIFREHQRPKYTVENIENDEFDNRNNDPQEYHRRLFKLNRPRIDESGVYTEGGLVYGPDAHITSTHHRKRKTAIKFGKLSYGFF